jgi:hypothetical protein
MISIIPATVDQVIRGRGGKTIVIDNDVSGIAKQLLEIDSRLRVSYSFEGRYFMIYLEGAAAHGRNHLVLTAEVLDGRVIQRCREVCRSDYDVGADLTAREAQIDADKDYQFSQQVGELSEHLAHAIKSDLKKGRPGPIYIPPDVY